MLLIIGIALGMLVKVVNAVEITFLDSTLSLALIPFDVNTTTAVAFLFFLIGVGFGVSSPIWGLVADKFNIFRELNLIGLAIGAVGYFLVGPAPFLHLDR
ncbi:MFS-type transporter SLC18B1-like [Ptychodera flava]|uniref:MFS-type transporter SLC18B1-like n=1 Tax=Ptychodera flava TaxID=63121 RepID=UPI003969F4F2